MAAARLDAPDARAPPLDRAARQLRRAAAQARHPRALVRRPDGDGSQPLRAPPTSRRRCRATSAPTATDAGGERPLHARRLLRRRRLQPAHQRRRLGRARPGGGDGALRRTRAARSRRHCAQVGHQRRRPLARRRQVQRQVDGAARISRLVARLRQQRRRLQPGGEPAPLPPDAALPHLEAVLDRPGGRHPGLGHLAHRLGLHAFVDARLLGRRQRALQELLVDLLRDRSPARLLGLARGA